MSHSYPSGASDSSPLDDPHSSAPFALRLAARLESDEDLRVALAPVDYMRWRDVLARALAAAGVPVD